MRCCSDQSYSAGGCSSGKDRCLFTSVLMLGALLGLMSSPAARTPPFAALIIIGVPLLTFAVAAPSRIGMFRELVLALRGIEATALSALLAVFGKRRHARAVVLRQHRRVEDAYANSSDRLAALVAEDPLRLHHARRLATFGALLSLIGGLSLPLLHGETFTFGDFPQAPFVFALDVLTFAVVSRVVGERMMIRLLEASHALSNSSHYQSGGTPWSARMRTVPLTTMLGAALGAVAALVVVNAGAVACAIETSWISNASFEEPARWFVQATAPMGIALGVCIGAILGFGTGMAQPPRADD